MIGDDAYGDAYVFIFREHLFTKSNANPNQAKRTTPLLRRPVSEDSHLKTLSPRVLLDLPVHAPHCKDKMPEI
jgi:hypothetical protein